MSMRAIVLCGPTASGKSALSLRIARDKKHCPDGGVIINADSMQVYRDLRVLTATPTDNEMALVPHRLYAYRDAAHACSVAEWLEAARIAIYETWQEGKMPVIVGGTGMYVNALLNGISPMPDIAPDIRDTARAMDATTAHSWLSEHDAVMAERLNPNDTQRLIRAVEVKMGTGKSLAEWQGIPPIKPIPQAEFDLYTLTLPRELLYERCNLRLTQMIEQGALDELAALEKRQLSPDLPAMRAVGVPELLNYLRGEWTLEQATEKAQQTTRNYAKRQLTWFRNQLPDARQIAFPYKDF